MEGDVSERLPVAEALEWGVMDEEGISPPAGRYPPHVRWGRPQRPCWALLGHCSKALRAGPGRADCPSPSLRSLWWSDCWRWWAADLPGKNVTEKYKSVQRPAPPRHRDAHIHMHTLTNIDTHTHAHTHTRKTELMEVLMVKHNNNRNLIFPGDHEAINYTNANSNTGNLSTVI